MDIFAKILLYLFNIINLSYGKQKVHISNWLTLFDVFGNLLTNYLYLRYAGFIADTSEEVTSA